MYGRVEAAAPLSTKETADKVLHHLQCAHRFTIQDNKWALEKSSCLVVIEISIELTEGVFFLFIRVFKILFNIYVIIIIHFFIAYIECCNKTENCEQKKRYLSSAKLMIVSTISQIEVNNLNLILKY